MATTTMTLTLKRAWWVMPYLYSVMWFSEVTGLEPDLDKVSAAALRGYSLVIK